MTNVLIKSITFVLYKNKETMTVSHKTGMTILITGILLLAALFVAMNIYGDITNFR